MEHSEIAIAAASARPVETVHHAGGRRTHYYEIDPRFDPDEWQWAIVGAAIARASGAARRSEISARTPA